MARNKQSCSNEQTNRNITVCSRRQKPFETLIVFDTEATGMKRRTRITELCMIAVLTGELKSSNRPRVINKLQLCFNPESAIQAEASRLTGLYNDVLEQMETFRNQVSLISSFLTSLPKPVCLIAHNGLRFDFPLLQSEFRNACFTLPAEAQIYCADSLHTFRVLDGLPATPEWIIQKEKEEKQRRDVINNKAVFIGDGTNSVKGCLEKNSGAAEIPIIVPISDSKQDSTNCSEEGVDVDSPNKRPASTPDNDTDVDQMLPKIKKTITDSELHFGSQSSVTDMELSEAYDSVIAHVALREFADGVSHPHQTTYSSLQQVQETTPLIKMSDPSTNQGPPVLRKHSPVPVTLVDRDKVSRKLFEDESEAVSAVKADSVLHHSDKLASKAADKCPQKGSLFIEEQLGEKQNISPYQLGSGEPASPTTKNYPKVDQLNVDTPQTKNSSPSLPNILENYVNLSSAEQESKSPLSSSAQASRSSTNLLASSSSSNSKRASYKQVEIYRREFGQYPTVAHTAEDDCLSLLKLIANKASDVLAFVEDHAVRFESVDPMY